ncbi:MAG: polynucleotide adenylyltransferase, partial [Syntrophothermus sp.]
MPVHKNLSHPVFKLLSEVSEKSGTPAYVIGGFVRDSIMGRPLKKDIDIVVLGSGIDFASRVAEKIGKKVPVKIFKNFGTAMLNFEGLQVEFVGARKESYRGDSRKPLVENGTIEDDQNRRDFTINAMA